MPQITMKALLESGVHFGHQTKRWNPKMKPYIFAARNGIYIIDLQKTLRYTREGVAFLRTIVRNGEKVMFVGTKKQAKDSIKEEAIRCGMPHVSSRWLGGTLTNFETIKSRVERLRQLEEMEATGLIEKYPVKEKMSMRKELKKLTDNLEGLKDMSDIPGCMFVIDVKREENAVKEANKLGIPVVAVVDTNCDPDNIDKIIPGNDDAIRAVRLMCKIMADTIIEEKVAMEKEKEIEIKKQEEEEAKKQAAADAENSEEASAIAADDTDYEKVFVDEKLSGDEPVRENAKPETAPPEEKKPEPVSADTVEEKAPEKPEIKPEGA
ncbi:MAG TPA: 30S ribosomal protein S2 [Firmicutes bacterium]|nr:30S ribosomal protein S2 [Bacillota bacterium]